MKPEEIEYRTSSKTTHSRWYVFLTEAIKVWHTPLKMCFFFPACDSTTKKLQLQRVNFQWPLMTHPKPSPFFSTSQVLFDNLCLRQPISSSGCVQVAFLKLFGYACYVFNQAWFGVTIGLVPWIFIGRRKRWWLHGTSPWQRWRRKLRQPTNMDAPTTSLELTLPSQKKGLCFFFEVGGVVCLCFFLVFDWPNFWTKFSSRRNALKGHWPYPKTLSDVWWRWDTVGPSRYQAIIVPWAFGSWCFIECNVLQNLDVGNLFVV